MPYRDPITEPENPIIDWIPRDGFMSIFRSHESTLFEGSSLMCQFSPLQKSRLCHGTSRYCPTPLQREAAGALAWWMGFASKAYTFEHPGWPRSKKNVVSHTSCIALSLDFLFTLTWATKTILLLFIESWLFNMDSYFMAYEIIPI